MEILERSGRPDIPFKQIAVLDQTCPTFSAGAEQPFVVAISPQEDKQLKLLQGDEPYDHTYQIEGDARVVTIVGSDERRGYPSQFRFGSGHIEQVTACSNVSLDVTGLPQETRIVHEPAAQIFAYTK